MSDLVLIRGWIDVHRDAGWTDEYMGDAVGGLGRITREHDRALMKIAPYAGQRNNINMQWWFCTPGIIKLRRYDE